MAPNAGNKKRRGLGALLSSKSPIEAAAPPDNSQQLPVAPANAANSTTSSGNTHITPIENHGQVPNVNEQRNLAVNERTGEVLDDDTGEVLTVTTTTTTVTKTETRRSRSPQPPPNRNNAVVQEQPVQGTTQQQFLNPSAALHPTNSNATLQHSTSNENASLQSQSVNSSSKSMRQQYNSTQQPMQDGAAPQRSAKENLKNAAVGLQDVRDSLRGTLNTTDLPIPRRNPARGSRAQQAPPVPPIRSPQPTLPTLPQATGQSHWQAPWPDPPVDTIEEEDVGESDRLRKRKSLSSMPASFSPESSGQLGREKSPRLFKRAKNKKMVT